MEIRITLELTPELKETVNALIDALQGNTGIVAKRPSVDTMEPPKEKPTIDVQTLRRQIKCKVQELVKADKKEAVKEVLKDFSASSVSALSDTVLPEVLKELTNLD